MYPSTDPYIFKTISVESGSDDINTSTSSTAANLIEVKITDLKKGCKYGVIVQAFNTKGPGPQSEEVVGETMLNDPPPAPVLSVGLVRLSSVELHWTFNDSSISSTYHLFPGDAGRSPNSEVSHHSSSSSSSPVLLDVSINGYYLHYKSPHSSWEERQISGQQTSYTFSDLLCGTYYQFYIIAYNNIGKGDPSQVVATKTKGGGESKNASVP